MIKKLKNTIHVVNIIEEGKLGGPQMRMALVAAAFKKSIFKNKIKITFIFPKKNSEEFQEQCNAFGIKYFLFSLSTISRDWISILKYLILYPFEVIMLVKFLKKNSFDVVHISGGSRYFKAIIAAKIAKIKIVWELNDTYAPILVRFVYFFLSRLADNFVFASTNTKKYYQKISPKKKSFLIQSPVNVNFYDPNLEYSNEAFIKGLVKKKKIIIGTVANVSPVKGFSNLLKAVEKLSFYSNRIVFIVVGSIYNTQKNYYKDLLKIIDQRGIRNFFFLGPRKDVRPLLKAMSIYVCSSNYEASPLSLWEAMSMKKAIVSNDVGDVNKFIKNGVNGYMVKKGDQSGLSKYLKKLIKDPKLRNALGKCARETTKNKLDLKICVKLHFTMYQTIIS